MCAESRPGGAARGNYSNESNDQYDIWVYWLSKVLLHSYCAAVVRPLPGGRMACGHGRVRDGARGIGAPEMGRQAGCQASMGKEALEEGGRVSVPLGSRGAGDGRPCCRPGCGRAVI